MDRILICKGRKVFATLAFKSLQLVETVVFRILLYVGGHLDIHARALASSVDKRDARHPSGHAKE